VLWHNIDRFSANLLLSVPMKEFCKSGNTWWC